MARFFALSLGASHSSVSALCHDAVHAALQRRHGANKCNVTIKFLSSQDCSESVKRTGKGIEKVNESTNKENKQRNNKRMNESKIIDAISPKKKKQNA